MTSAPPRRSCLVVPGHAARMHAKALGGDADEVVFDLEDAVAPDAKQQAREQIARTLAEASSGRRVAIRVNVLDGPEAAADLALCAQLARPGLSVVVPKAETVAALGEAADALPGEVALQALVETPAGLLNARELAAAPRVGALILGYADLAAALHRRDGAAPSWLVAQELLLAAARAAGVEAIDGPHFRLGDADGLARAVRAVRSLGYDGKWAIHPEQVGPINDGFASSAAERAWAEGVQHAVSAAGADGSAVARYDGTMVDEAMARRARRLAALPAAPEPPAQTGTPAGAPYFDELRRGDVFRAPAMTLTSGAAALHQAIVGDRLRLALDAPLHEAVTGRPGVLAHPHLVCDVSIGQSTAPSGRVLGNLFYRGLACRPVAVGTTLRTRTEVVALRAASRGRGIAALRVTTTDEAGRAVLDFWRCPLLPSRDGAESEEADDLADVGHGVDAHALVPDWTLQPLREEPLGPLFADLQPGAWLVEAGETVTAAPELARLTLNTAFTHTDATAGAHGRRLVYGGHVIGVAAAHVTRVLPDLATVLAWASCDHLGPVFEGDLLHTRLELERLEPLADGGLVHWRAHVRAHGKDDDTGRAVLDWQAVGLMP